MFRIFTKILIFSLILNQFKIFGQSSESITPDIEIGINVFSYLHNLIGFNDAFGYKEEFVPRYFDGLSFKFVRNKFQYRFDFSYYKYHNQYTLSKCIYVADFDEKVDGIFRRFNIIPGIEKDFLDYRIQPHIFIGINFCYTIYSGVFHTYSTLWGWDTGHKFNIKTPGIGLLISPGIRLKINDKISMIFESSLVINNNIKKTYKKDIITLEKFEFKINPIETLGINYRFDLK